MNIPPPPMWEPAPPGSAASFFWLARHFIMMMETHGLRLDRQSLEYLAHTFIDASNMVAEITPPP